MAKYQGHRSWNAWNVSLWIANDEPMYRWAMELLERRNAASAARAMIQDLAGQRTPDEAPYTLTSVREALAGLR